MLAIDDPCLVFALARESGPFRREFRPQQRFPSAQCWARFCGPAWLSVLVVHAGIGRERVQQVVDWLAEPPRMDELPYHPKLLLSAGFSGGLQEGLAVGDIVLATEVLEEDGSRWPATWPAEMPAGEWRPPLQRGRVLTVNRLVATPEEKSQLGQKHQALAVDMESAVLARYCARHSIPFGCVRAISDDVQAALSPEVLHLLAGANASAWRVATTLCRHPKLLPELWRLGQQTKHAARQLGLALGELLTLTLPFSGELDGGLAGVPVA